MKSHLAFLVAIALVASPLGGRAAEEVPPGFTPIANASVVYGDGVTQSLVYQDEQGVKWQTVVPGMNVRCPESPSVYWIGADGKRYVYPMEYVFTTRYHVSSQKVVWLPCETLDVFAFGGRMPLRAGSLMKTELNPKVYVVMADQTIRPIPDEETAQALFGGHWASLVFDLPETFFTDYVVGEELSPTDLPDGLLGQGGDGTPAISWRGEWRQLDWSTALSLRFNDVGGRYFAGTDVVKAQLLKKSSSDLIPMAEVPGQASRMIGNPWAEPVAEQPPFPVVYGNVY